jgi:hypothetical protein
MSRLPELKNLRCLEPRIAREGKHSTAKSISSSRTVQLCWSSFLEFIAANYAVRPIAYS